MQQLFPALHCLPVAYPSVCATCPEPECQQAGGDGSLPAGPLSPAGPWRLSPAAAAGKHSQAQASPCTPSGPTAKAEQLGAASGSVYVGLSSQRSLPSGPGPQASDAPGLVRFCSYISQLGLGSQAPVAESSSHSYLSWMPWAPTRPGARTRCSRGRQPNSKARETPHCRPS